jgi:hypothetical protein
MSLADLREMKRERAKVINHTGLVSCCARDKEQPCFQMLSGSWDTTQMVRAAAAEIGRGARGGGGGGAGFGV